MSRSVFSLSWALITALAGCGQPERQVVPAAADASREGAPAAGAGLANPASEHCVEAGGRLEMRRGSEGEYGVCVFDDGSRCEEWRFFRGECRPGECRDPAGICEKNAE
ncbi:MAG: DUF333 domain-containing protein [Polyangia bacterium]